MQNLINRKLNFSFHKGKWQQTPRFFLSLQRIGSLALPTEQRLKGNQV